MLQQPSTQESSSNKKPKPVLKTSTYMTDPEASDFCQIFSEGLESGLSYSRILDFVERKGMSTQTVANLRHALLKEGLMLGEAFAKYGILDPPAQKLILVAEEQGSIPEAFKNQKPIYHQRHERKKRILFSWAEPLFITFLCLFILYPLQTNVVRIFEAQNAASEAFQVLMGPLTLGFVMVLGLLFCGFAWLHTPVDFGLRQKFNSIWMRIPVVSRAGRLYAVSLFAKYMGSSLSSGMNIYDSIFLAAQASHDPRMLDHIHDVLDSIENGASLHQALTHIKALPDDVIEHIDLGEETGRLEELLGRIAEIYETRSLESFERLISTIIFISRIVIVFGVLLMTLLGLVKNLGKSFETNLEILWLPTLWWHIYGTRVLKKCAPIYLHQPKA